MISLDNFQYENEDSLIAAFKSTIKPLMSKERVKGSDFSETDIKEYNKITKWLKEQDYYIVQFPNVIEQRLSIDKFGNEIIRNYIMEKRGNTSDAVSWQERRELVDELQIVKRYDSPVYRLSSEIEGIIKDISTDKGEFHTANYDRQLELLNNAIENLLNKDGKYMEIYHETFYDFFTNNDIKKFRNDTQVFRHAKESTLQERKSWSEQKKKFYVRVGISIVSQIFYSNQNN